MARLPQPGGDAGNWGQILNDFLGEAHQSNGALKPDAVTETALATGDGANGDILIKDTAAPAGMKWATVSGVSGTGTDLSASSTATSISLSSSSGTGTVLSAATSIAAGILTAADKTKLDAIAAGATANSTDAQLRDRATHTGTQAISTVSGLQAALDAKAASSTVYTRSEVDTALAAKANTASLSAVAASGSYTDLTNRPTIPAQVNLAAGTNVTITGTYPNLTVAATPGAGVTDLSTTTTATNVTVASSTGVDAVIAAATTTDAGVLSATDKTKLNGIATGATANATDAQLRDRSTHTGTQAISTVTGLQTALDGKVATGSLSTVASTGVYSDLSGRPTIPAQVNLAAGTNVSITGTYPNLTVSATPGAGVTDLSTTTTATTVTVVSSSGADATVAAATSTDAGVMSAADKTKLNGIATGATANSTDAQLRDRSTHTGTQAIATVTGLQTAIDGKADDSSVVHLTGAETVAGVKTFSSSPIGPTPTVAQQLATKSYVDSVASSGFSQNMPWFIVTEAPYSADNTGTTDARAAIQQAIDDAGAAGGGVVYIPGGDYLIGYTSAVGSLGCAGGLQLHRNVWLKGEGQGSRLVPTGTWDTVAGVVGIGDATASRGSNAIYNVRVSDLFIKSAVGPLTSGPRIANTVAVLFNTDNGASPLEPDAAHRIHDLLIWDMDTGIMILGNDDQAMMVQRIRGRRFTNAGMQVGRADSSGGGPDNYFAFLDFSSANIGGGTSSVFEIYASNCHFVSCKAWYAKRSTAFTAGQLYKDGAGWFVRATRNIFSACEAQDNGGHGFLISYGKNTFTGCIADSNSYYANVSGSAATNECSGFYIGSGVASLNVDSLVSFNRSATHLDQKYGVYIDSAARGIHVTGQAVDNRSTGSSADPNDGVFWSGARHDSHIVSVNSYYAGTSYITIVNPAVGGGTVTYLASKTTVAQENLVTGTALTADAALVIGNIIGGAARYRVEGYIQYQADATQMAKFGVSLAISAGSGTFDGMLGWDYVNTAGTSTRSTTYSLAPSTVNIVQAQGAGVSTAGTRSAQISGQIFLGVNVTTGALTVQLAENTATGAGVKIMAGSWVRLTQM